MAYLELNRNKFGVATLAIIAISFAVVFFFLFDLGAYIFSTSLVPKDSLSYIESADRLYNELKPHPYRPLGFAFILGIPNLLFETVSLKQFEAIHHFWRIAKYCCMDRRVDISLYLYKTLLLFFSSKACSWLSVFSMLSIGAVAQIFLVLTESVTALILSMVVYQLFKYHLDKRLQRLILSAAFINLLILIRPGFLYLGALGTVLTLGCCIYKRHSPVKASVLFISSLALLVVQLSMMKSTYGKATISFIDKVTWYYYLGAEAEGKATNKDYMTVYDERHALLSDKSYLEMMTICSADMTHQISDNFNFVITEYSKNIIENSYGGAHVLKHLIEIKSTENRAFSIEKSFYILSRLQNVFYVVLFLFSIALFLKRRMKTLSLFITMTIIGYVILTSGISFWQGDRFHFILYPAILLVFIFLIKDSKFGTRWLKPKSN